MDIDGVMVDDKVVEALALYVTHGLNPGSFGMCVLEGRRNDAHRHAHPYLYNSLRNKQDAVKNTFAFADRFLPEECYGSKKKIEVWVAHQGLRKLDMSTKVLMRLQLGRKPWFMLKLQDDAIEHIWGLEGNDLHE